MPSYRLFYDGSGQFNPPETPPANLPHHLEIMIGGQKKTVPVAYLWKDVLQPGVFGKRATGQVLEMPPSRIQKALASTKAFLANGNACPIPYKDHEEETNAGFVVDARIKEGRLELLHQLITEKMAEAALRNHVSVMFKTEFTDPKGNNYEDVIVHSSLTNDPVIIGQQQWSSLAASRGESADAPLLTFAASGSSFMNLAQLRKLLGLGDNVPDDQVIKKAEEVLGTLPALKQEKDTLTTQLSQKSTEVTNLTTELNTKKQEVVTLSQKHNVQPPTAQTMFFARSAYTAKRDQLIHSGSLSKAAADKIEERFIGKGKLDTISLSKEPSNEDIGLCAGIGRALETMEVLEGTKPGPESGDTKTGDQGGTKDGTQTAPNTKAGQPDDKKEGKEGEKEEQKVTMSQAAVKAGTRGYAFPKRKTATA